MVRPPATPAFMVQGTGSHVGKSLMVAGLARLFARRGLRVRPFKPQNMSNNAAATVDGGEIGRAQALQARAARVEPVIDMNPVLLKPEGETGAQVIVQGKRMAAMKAREYGKHKAALLPRVMESYHRLAGDADLVICEGAGSVAEINLRAGDIANMGFAEAAEIPVVLVGDIERGGVIASLIGTQAVLPHEDAARIKGFIVNKFRGDKTLFSSAAQHIADETGWKNLGVIPYFDGAGFLPAEDSLDLMDKAIAKTDSKAKLHIAVPLLPRIANFDDLDPLHADPAFRLTVVERGRSLPLDTDLILLPGSKAVMADLAALRDEGWDIDIAALLRGGARIMGLCGGYQMLGRAIHDPDGIEGRKGSVEGLGLLDVQTTLTGEKAVGQVRGVMAQTNIAVRGYEIHLGETTGADCARPMLIRDGGEKDGAMSRDGKVMGCYLHGIFASDSYRASWAGGGASGIDFDGLVEETIDALAEHIAAHLDIDALEKIAGL